MFELFVGVILSFVDFIIDIFILVEYYCVEYFKWFRVGFVFVVLLCLCYIVVYWYWFIIEYDNFRWVKMLFFICYLFVFVFMKLKEFFVCLKKKWMKCVDVMNLECNVEFGDDVFI